MTRRQYLVWMAWLPYESARIEFQPPTRTDRRGPEKWRLTKEQAKRMNLEVAKAQFGALLRGAPAGSGPGVVTKPR